MTAEGGEQVPFIPHGPQREPSGLLEFSFVLSFPLSNMGIVHVRAMTIIYNGKMKTF